MLRVNYPLKLIIEESIESRIEEILIATGRSKKVYRRPLRQVCRIRA